MVTLKYFSGRSLATLLLAALIAVAGLTSVYTRSAWAVNPDEVLSDPVLEKRARNLSTGLRCMVCQNQSIDDSDADLARDLRLLVRERLVQGDTDEQVIDFLVDRYGEFVLLKPRLDQRTVILWSFPALILLAGIGVIWYSRRKAGGAPAPIAPLSEEETKRLEKLLDGQ